MPIGTCASLDNPYLSVTIEKPAPNASGSVLIDCHFHHDGVSVRPDCDGPVIYLRIRNNSNMPAWGYLPNKKKGDKWVKGDPGTDVTITSPGQFNNLGLDNYSDVAGLIIVFQEPV